MPKEKKELPVLSEEQKAFIRENVSKMESGDVVKMRDLCRKTWKDESLTLRNVESTAVKVYIATLGENGFQSRNEETDFLTEEQKTFIANNFKDCTLIEILRTLFGDHHKSMACREGREIVKFCRKLDPHFLRMGDEPVEDEKYSPPRTITEMISRVNKLVPNPNDVTKPIYDKGHLTEQDQKCLHTLMQWLSIPRFILQASQYIRKGDRELFESSFIGQTYNKVDLSREDIEMYIIYCASIVRSLQTEGTLQQLQARATDSFETDEKVAMTLVDHIKTLKSDLQEEEKKQKDLYKTLNGARSTRINDMTQASLSMHPLVSAWRKKEGRERLLKMASKYRDKLEKEVVRLTEVDQLRGELWGIDPESIAK